MLFKDHNGKRYRVGWRTYGYAHAVAVVDEETKLSWKRVFESCSIVSIERLRSFNEAQLVGWLEQEGWKRFVGAQYQDKYKVDR